MKNIIALLVIFAAAGLAALPSTTVWEVRPTVGSDSSGGCFDSAKSGTDYSQQNAAQFSGTNLVSVSSLVVSSVTHNFVATDVGNCMNITAGTGFTTGVYEIVSVSANQATLDRSPGTVGVSGTWAEGGALATISFANTNATPNNTVWVKATGTYTATSALVITLDSHEAPGNPYSISGYTSTRGDNGKVTWTTATNSIDLIDANGAVNVLLANINFTTTAATKGDGIKASNVSTNVVNFTVINCVLTGFSIGIEGNFAVDTSFVGLFLINSRVTGSVSHGVRNGVTNNYIFGSMLDNNGGDGFNTGTSQAISNNAPTNVFENSIIYKNGANGINVAFTDASNVRVDPIIVSNCDISTNTGAGILTGSATNPLVQASNSIFDANGTYGIDTTSTSIIMNALIYDNAFFNNTTAPTRGVNAGSGTITLTANPYTTIGSNFALNNTAGGGAALKGVGYPGTIPNGGIGGVSVGALTPAASSGGGQVGFGIVQ